MGFNFLSTLRQSKRLHTIDLVLYKMKLSITIMSLVCSAYVVTASRFLSATSNHAGRTTVTFTTDQDIDSYYTLPGVVPNELDY